MVAFRGLNNTELLRTIFDIAEKKDLSSEKLFFALEESIRIAGREKYGNSKLHVKIHRKTGAISVLKQIMVVDDSDKSNHVYYSGDEDSSDMYEAMKISEAIKRYPEEEIQIGSIVSEQLPSMELGRLAVNSAKYSMMKLIKECEQEKQYNKYKDKVGEVIVGVIRKVNKGGVVLDLGDAEAYLHMRDAIRGESFRQGERIRVVISAVDQDKNCQISVSRASNEFIEGLFKQEVSEIYDGIVQIMAVARESGSKAKIAVQSSDKNIDPLGTCIGIRGSRIQSIIKELNGEKIDVIVYSPDIIEYVTNAISPASVTKAIIHEDTRSIELIVGHDQLSLAIGKKGQNVRLASVLIGWKIDLLSEGDASNKKLEEFGHNTDVLVNILNVEEIVAQLLITEGFISAEDIAGADLSVMSNIEGFDTEIAQELIKRSQEHLNNRINDSSSLHNIEGLSNSNILLLQKHEISDLTALADLSRDEFNDTVNQHNFTDEEIDKMIISARKKLGWFNK